MGNVEQEVIELVSQLDASAGSLDGGFCEIVGADCSSFGEREIHLASVLLGRTGMVLFREQNLGETDLLRLARGFGDTHLPHRQDTHLQRTDGLTEFLSEPDEEPNRNFSHWHGDLKFLQNPACYSMLSCVIAPEKGWGTDYANLRNAFESLTTARQNELRGLRCIVSAPGLTPAGTPPVVMPMVRAHPVTGLETFYAVAGFVREVIGFSRDDSDALLAELLAYVTQAEFVYNHHWKNKDLIIWDNRCTLHRRSIDLPTGQRRHMRRVQAKREYWGLER